MGGYVCLRLRVCAKRGHVYVDSAAERPPANTAAEPAGARTSNASSRQPDVAARQKLPPPVYFRTPEVKGRLLYDSERKGFTARRFDGRTGAGGNGGKGGGVVVMVVE